MVRNVGTHVVENLTGQPQAFHFTDGYIRLPRRGPSDPMSASHAQRLVSMGVAKIIEDLSTPKARAWLDKNNNPAIHWSSPFSMGDGYATAAESVVHAAIAAGIDVQVDHCWFLVEDGLLPKTVALLKEPKTGDRLVGVCLATPGEFKKISEPYKIGWTMYESTDPLVPHPEWRHECNEVDRLWVPCEWCKDIFGRFVERPIDVVPLAVNPIYCNPKKREPKDTFTIICYATLTGRKSPQETLEVFERAFPKAKYPDVRIVFKTRMGFFGFDNFQLPDIHDDRVKIISEDWYPEQMLEFLDSADCMLYLSKGEGFGLTPREALARGVPLIVADNTGMSEICDSRYNFPIPTASIETSRQLGGEWYIPNYDYAADVLRWVYEYRETAYDMAYRGAHWFGDEHGSEAVGLSIKNVLLSLDPITEHQTNTLISERRAVAQLGFEERELQGKYGFFYEALREKLATDADYVHLLNPEGLVFDAMSSSITEVAVSRQASSNGNDMTAASVGQMHKLLDCDIRKYLRHLLLNHRHVFFAVPTVYRTERSFELERLMRKEQWAYILKGFHVAEMEYSPDKQYLYVSVSQIALTRGTLVKGRGRKVEGVWRPGELVSARA